mgnify:CR=1 FL=1
MNLDEEVKAEDVVIDNDHDYDDDHEEEEDQDVENWNYNNLLSKV